MKKRLLAMLLVLALAVSALTVGVSAGIPMSLSLERGDSESGDNWHWNGKTRTLILQGGVIEAPDGIYIDCDATIKVTEDTWIEGYIVVDGELTVKGSHYLSLIADTETAITADEDVIVDGALIEVASGKYGIYCGGTFEAVESELYGFQLETFIVAEEIEISDSDVVGSCEDSVLFADENVSVEWSLISCVSNGPVICAGEDVLIEACELYLYSDETSVIWAGDDIKIRDCDLEYDVYEDELDDADHPLFNSSRDVIALFYEDDDELAYAISAETSLSAYSDVFRFVATLEEGVPGDFSDVSSSDWFADAVDYVSSKGLMIGTGRKTFSPNETVSNAMAWMILARINDAYTVGNAYWYDAAQSFVVTNGLSDGLNPDGAITREAFITMLFKSNGSYCVRDLSGFADAASISADAVEPMRWAVENGIIKGADGKLNPKGYMTRAELAEILMRLG